MENLSIEDVNYLLDCLKLKENEFTSKGITTIIIGAIGKGEPEEKAKKTSLKLKELAEQTKVEEEKITFIKAKLYKLRDKLNQEKITKDANDILS